jgi:hypothetical protein
MPAVRLNVTTETYTLLSELAGKATVSRSQFVRRLVELICGGKTVSAKGLIDELKAERTKQLGSTGKTEAAPVVGKSKNSGRKKPAN